MTDRLRSQDGRYELVIQNDGNLVVYGANGRPVWASGVDQNPDQPQVPEPPTTPPGANLKPLTIDGTTFREDGRIWKYRCASAFLLYYQWLNGLAAAEQYVKWALSNGINTVRVFGMINWPDVRFGPGQRSAWDTYIRQIEAFLRWTNAWGLRVEWVTIADAKALMPEQRDQADYNEAVTEMFEDFGPVNLKESCNEPFHPVNQVDANAITGYRAASVLQALGDYEFRIVGDEGYYYHRNYFTQHAPRDAEWMRKGGKDLLEITRLGYTKDPNNPETANMRPIPMPALNDEPMGIGVEEPGRRSADPKAHAEQQAAAMLFAAGSTIHGDFGLRTRVPEGFDQECVWAIVKAWDAVPANAQLGQYTRSGMADCPLKWKNDALRIYAMLTGNTATAVVIQPNRAEDFEPQNGWRVESRVGPVYNLSR